MRPEVIGSDLLLLGSNFPLGQKFLLCSELFNTLWLLRVLEAPWSFDGIESYFHLILLSLKFCTSHRTSASVFWSNKILLCSSNNLLINFPGTATNFSPACNFPWSQFQVREASAWVSANTKTSAWSGNSPAWLQKLRRQLHSPEQLLFYIPSSEFLVKCLS